MKIGEVALMTRDVVGMAAFYKWLLGVDNGSSDPWHPVILAEETMLTVCFDNNDDKGGGISLAFTVEDVDAEYVRLAERGVEIIDLPTVRPWGMKNMCFYDPDGNRIYFRSILK